MLAYISLRTAGTQSPASVRPRVHAAAPPHAPVRHRPGSSSLVSLRARAPGPPVGCSPPSPLSQDDPPRALAPFGGPGNHPEQLGGFLRRFSRLSWASRVCPPVRFGPRSSRCRSRRAWAFHLCTLQGLRSSPSSCSPDSSPERSIWRILPGVRSRTFAASSTA
jgi:hypothetical protein